MPTQDAPWSADRLASLARTAAEADRTVASQCAADLAKVVSSAHAAVGDDFPDDLLTQLEGTLISDAAGADEPAATLGGETVASRFPRLVGLTGSRLRTVVRLLLGLHGRSGRLGGSS